MSSDVSLPSVSSTPPPVPKRGKAPPPPAANQSSSPISLQDASYNGPVSQPISSQAPPPSGQSPTPDPSEKRPAPRPIKWEPTADPNSEAKWPVAQPPVSLSPPGSPSQSSDVPMTIGPELIELVRKNTSLSYELSRVAVGVVVGHLQGVLPKSSSDLERVLVSLVESKVSDAQSAGSVVLCHMSSRAHVCV